MSNVELPEDVLRGIFECALGEDVMGRKWKADCCRFALVSKPVQSIVEPILYREIDVTSDYCCEVIDRTIQYHPAKPSDFFVLNVKAIRVSFIRDDVVFVEALRRILVACKGIQKYENTVEVADRKGFAFGFAISASHRSKRLFHTLHASVTPPKHLTICEHGFSPYAMSFYEQIFTNVTHLCISGESEWSWEELSRLRHLTHLKVQLRRPRPTDILFAVMVDPHVGVEEQILQRFLAALSGLTPLQLVILERVYTAQSKIDEEIQQIAEADMRIVVRGNIQCAGRQDGPCVCHYVILYESQPLDVLWKLGEAQVEWRRRGVVEWPPSLAQLS